MSDAHPVFACTCGVAWGTAEGPCVCEVPAHFRGESDPIATNPILRGVDLALDRLVRHDCFTERTLSILDELRAEVAGASTPDELRASYGTPDHMVRGCQESPDTEIANGSDLV